MRLFRIITTAGTAFAAPVVLSMVSEYWVALADVNEDGDLDLLSRGTGTLRLRLGNGDGTFGAAVDFPTPDIRVNGPFGIGDLNHDGHLDLVYSNPLPDGLGVLFGDGEGHLGGAKVHPALRSTVRILADVDKDGHLDVIGDDYGNDIVVTYGDGAGGLIEGEVYDTFTTAGLAVGDLNGDGRPDAAVALSRWLLRAG